MKNYTENKAGGRMPQIKVSVVIPVYNMEAYLEECLASVRGQTLREIEIICVDDGSADRSPEILEKQAALDQRIQVIHKENSGYGNSVNVGIGQASGGYISIVEPDDYIREGMLERLYFCAEKYCLDIASADYLWFYDEADRRVFLPQHVYEDRGLYGKVINPFADETALDGGFINPAGIFRREFLTTHGIWHNETPGAAFQDRGFCFLSLIHARRIMVLEEAFYCYRHDNPSSSIAGTGNMDRVIEEYRRTREKLGKLGPEYQIFLPELTKREYGSGRYALSRCSMESWGNAFRLLREDFLRLRGGGTLNLDRFPEEWSRELLWMLDDPDGFYQSYVGLAKEIHEKTSEYEMIIIYGAGAVGKRIYDRMEEEDRNKVIGFAVTDEERNPSSYKNCDIKGIDAYVAYREKAAVIVGAGGKNREEIAVSLRSRNFSAIIPLESEGASL